MRRGRNPQWLLDGDNLIGVSLGADYVAEHEWGLEDLWRILGVSGSEDVVGIERYRVNGAKAAECVRLIPVGDNEAAMIASIHSREYTKLDGELSLYRDEELSGAWSGRDFGVGVREKQNCERLAAIHAALFNGDAAVWQGGGGIFENCGLCIAIVSAIPRDKLAQMEESHSDRAKLKAAAGATGIKQKIDAKNEAWKQFREVETGRHCWERAPHDYFALSPRWNTEKCGKYPVIFWLNPRHQDCTNYGSFTVEELEQWLEGTGPIPMTEKQKRARARV